MKEENVGQALLVLAQIQEIEMLIVNVYMWPVASKPQFDSFLMQLQIEIEALGCPNVICCGDFNAVMDNTKDRTAAGLHPTRTLTGFAKSTELIDTFRVFNPLSRRVTYFAKSVGTGRRLDYIFASGFFMNLIRNAAILPRSFSDHNPTTLELCLHRNPKGPGYWKFPDPLAQNKKFVAHLKGKIHDEVQRHKTDYNPSTLWDMVKVCVLRETCRFLHWDKIGDKQTHENFQAQIAQLAYERNNADAQRALALNSEIEQTTAKWETFLDKINKKRLELNLGRKRYEDQRSSKYFFRRFNAIPVSGKTPGRKIRGRVFPIITPGSSSLMYDKEGNFHSEDADILAICHKFYTDLNNKPEKPHSTPYAFIPDQSSPRLLNDLAENIDIDEMYKALQGMRKNKAPGLDGLTVQFYLTFWTEISPILLQCIQFVQEQKCLSPSQCRGIVKLIPKKDKNPAWVQNLRPITLLNLDVKICT